MPDCSRCLAIIESGTDYCPVCNRPQIVESLRAWEVPAWHGSMWRVVAGLLGFWLVTTLGIAFLREARAVSRSRQLLAEDQAAKAWSLLEPFLQDHPEHRQALFICGRATVRLGLENEAKHCLAGVIGQSPDLGKELKEDYRVVLTQKVHSVGCDAASFEQLLGWEEALGTSFGASVVAGLDRIVDACGGSGNYPELSRLSAIMTQKGQEGIMVEKGYVPAITRAMAQSRYPDAEGLARQAVQDIPGGAKAIDAALDSERRKVIATVDTLRRLCQEVAGNTQYWTGVAWCFPTEPPPSFQSARDGWGRSFVYTPSYPYGEPLCHQQFSVTSYGSDGGVTEHAGQTPAAEMSCVFSSWSVAWRLPSEFWQTAG